MKQSKPTSSFQPFFYGLIIKIKATQNPQKKQGLIQEALEMIDSSERADLLLGVCNAQEARVVKMDLNQVW